MFDVSNLACNESGCARTHRATTLLEGLDSRQPAINGVWSDSVSQLTSQ